MPAGLGVPIPQDYVNYVKLSWIDNSGVQRIIYPVNNLTDSPYTLPIQDSFGIPIQNEFGQNNLAEQSLTEKRWNAANDSNVSGSGTNDNMYVFD